MKRREQRGAALLTVLLLTATIAALAVVMTETITRSLARATAGEARDQAFWAMVGIERTALQIIEEQGSDLDQPTAPLFAEPIIIPFEGGTATISFSEASNCFNINDLVDADDGNSVADEGAAERFARLVQAIGGNLSAGQQLAARTTDFIDRDSRVETGGAEDYDYSRRDVPYRTAGGFLASVSELRAIAGFSRDVYGILAPQLCALPKDGTQELNVNTLAPGDVPLLIALAGDGLARATAERLVTQKPPNGYDSVEAFIDQPLLAGAELAEDFSAFLSTKSTLVEMEIVLESPLGRLRQVSLVERGEGGTEVLERRVGERLP